MRDGCAVVMPQMGESIEEGKITRWLVEVGSLVERDQPLLEVSTEKVDAEIPSPASGVLVQIFCPAGTTVPVNTAVAWIGPYDAEPVASGGDAPQAPPGELNAGLQRKVDPQPSAQPYSRGLWFGLAIWFIIRLVWALYELAQGEVMIYRPLTSAAALLFCVAQLVTAKRKLWYRLLILLSLVLLLAFVMLFALEARGR